MKPSPKYFPTACCYYICLSDSDSRLSVGDRGRCVAPAVSGWGGPRGRGTEPTSARIRPSGPGRWTVAAGLGPTVEEMPWRCRSLRHFWQPMPVGARQPAHAPNRVLCLHPPCPPPTIRGLRKSVNKINYARRIPRPFRRLLSISEVPGQPPPDPKPGGTEMPKAAPGEGELRKRRELPPLPGH